MFTVNNIICHKDPQNNKMCLYRHAHSCAICLKLLEMENDKNDKLALATAIVSPHGFWKFY